MITRMDMKAAKEQLRRNVMEVDPEAVEYIDWDAFEGVLEAVLSTSNPTNAMIHQVFKSSINKAQMLRVLNRPMGPTN